MAASSTNVGQYMIPGGNGKRVEYGTITFDSDATVEVATTLSRIDAFHFAPAGSGGNAAMLSIDETVTSNGINVSGGAVTVDATGASTDVWFFQLIGW